jgi:hypothetical protein
VDLEGSFPNKEQVKFFDAKTNEVNIKINQLKRMKKRLEDVRKTIENDECVSF